MRCPQLRRHPRLEALRRVWSSALLQRGVQPGALARPQGRVPPRAGSQGGGSGGCHGCRDSGVLWLSLSVDDCAGRILSVWMCCLVVCAPLKMNNSLCHTACNSALSAAEGSKALRLGSSGRGTDIATSHRIECCKQCCTGTAGLGAGSLSTLNRSGAGGCRLLLPPLRNVKPARSHGLWSANRHSLLPRPLIGAAFRARGRCRAAL